MLDATSLPEPSPFAGRRIAFAGKLGGLSKREAHALIRQQGGEVVDVSDPLIEFLVFGAEQLPLDAAELLDESTRRAVDEGRLRVLSETEFWTELGMLDDDESAHRFYTPAMLAELLRIPLATIRRWHRRGLIVPAMEVHRLPYFDFREVAAARQLAGLVAAGVTPLAIEKKLALLSRFVPNVDRSLRQLAVIVEGREILLRQGDGLVEPNGQLRFDFESCELGVGLSAIPVTAPPPAASTLNRPSGGAESASELLRSAVELEELGQLESAAEMYRAALAAGGPRAELCFQLAELLYRMGDVPGARERYYMAIELDEDLVEARANLGCVLAETGELELSVAAFEGALVHHPYYADVHYHLARTLGELRRDDQAREHWRTFLRLAPESPWAEEARTWLNLSDAEACV